ncbi:hypothetical protein J5N97_027032 [Dioscorea zingiberensis]|uniref:Uncharacterized protein n=1 Tax=Dioscorea zingiberensis TaxID=325984 RepID=A0A9D5C4I0_9LILI|nr:hypothetical protein J5N97_027032 [Dioscorea zingiberensis]
MEGAALDNKGHPDKIVGTGAALGACRMGQAQGRCLFLPIRNPQWPFVENPVSNPGFPPNRSPDPLGIPPYQIGSSWFCLLVR